MSQEQNVAVAGPATPGPQPFAWVSHNGMTSEQYQELFDKYVKDGFRLTQVSGYTLRGCDRYAAIWVKRDGPAWVARHRMTSEEYQAAFDQYVREGFRLVDVSGYAREGVANYAAIWVKETGPEWVARHGLTSSEYQAAFDEYVARGFRLSLVSGYTVEGTDFYAAIWTRGGTGSWQARHRMSSAQYQAIFDQLVAQGYRLDDVSGYTVNGEASYAALWSQTPGPAFYARHGLTAAEYQQVFDQQLALGFRLQLVNGYEVNGADLYAAIWVKD